MREPQVLFATDLRGDVQTGLALAARLAHERAATLTILHVVQSSPKEGEGMLTSAIELLSDLSARQLESLEPDDPTVPVVRISVTGDPKACIIEFAAQEQVCLLVMEAAPRSWIARTLGRSLVERVMSDCPCPVVTYHPRRRKPRSVLLPRLPRRRLSEEELTTILNARVETLVSWMHLHEQAVADLAAQRDIQDAVASLYRARSATGVFARRTRRLLSLKLAEYQRGWEAIGVEVIAKGESVLRMGTHARRDQDFADFARRITQSGRAVSVPVESDDYETNRLVVLVGAALLGPASDAMVVFAFDARRDFLRILAQPGPVPSAETYAFDPTGIMLSNTRFPQQLRQIGLLPKHVSVQTARRIRVCDPGGNLLLGQGLMTSSLPLTRAATAAIAGQDGSDFHGYRDYRGVEVVGAWRWLADYGFGVTAEVDRDVF